MPDWRPHLRQRLASLRLDPVRENEIVDELSQHLDDRYDELRADGVADAEARRLALVELREPEVLGRSLRSLRQANAPPAVTPGQPGRRLLGDLSQDLRYAARGLRRDRSFTIAAALTMALGIGTSTAIFSLVDATVLHQLPFADAASIAAIWADNAERSPRASSLPLANADIADLRRHSDSFASVAAFAPGTANLSDGDEIERVGAVAVTAGFFETLGVAPLLGRTISRDEERPEGARVVLVSHGLWQRRFAGDATLVGRAITIGGQARTVVGVLPPGFDFPRGPEWPSTSAFPGRADVWLPLGFRAHEDGSGWSNWESRHERGVITIARLKPDVSYDRARAELDAVSARTARDHADTHRGWRLTLVPLREQLAQPYRTPLLLLSAAAALLLAVAAVNVANLLLTRGAARRREMAIRAALGAVRRRLVRQLVTESLLLSALSTGLGVAVAYVCLAAFRLLNPIEASRLNDATVDVGTLGFAALLALVTSVLAGLVPALPASRVNLGQVLHEGGRSGDSSGWRLRGWLVGAEVGLAVVSLAIAGLLARSLWRVLSVDPGFRADAVLAFEFSSPPAQEGEGPFLPRLEERLAALPGVEAVGAISYLPLSGGLNNGRFVVEGQPAVDAALQPRAERRWVTPGYFAAMGVPIRRGRVFTPRDTVDQPPVIVINDTLANRFLTGRNPLGARLLVGGRWRAVAGVVSDVKSASLEAATTPQVYLPHAQDPWPPMTVAVKAASDPRGLAGPVRATLQSLSPQARLARMRTMQQLVAQATGARRLNVAVLGFFAGAALLLSAIGIYGVVAFVVGRRSREIAVRLTMGAGRGDVLRLILGQGLTPVGLGALAGLAASLAASRLVAHELYEVSPADPLTVAAIVAVVGIVALIASWLPARCATRVDPADALRQD